MSDKAIKKTLTIKNQLGLHARPAALLVQLTNTFQADITVDNGSQKVNGKSIMGLMMLAAACNTKVQIEAIGPDAAESVAKIKELFDQKFHEE